MQLEEPQWVPPGAVPEVLPPPFEYPLGAGLDGATPGGADGGGDGCAVRFVGTCVYCGTGAAVSYTGWETCVGVTHRHGGDLLGDGVGEGQLCDDVHAGLGVGVGHTQWVG